MTVSFRMSLTPDGTVDLRQVFLTLVQAAGFQRTEQRPVENMRFGYAAHLAREDEAIVAEPAFPAALGLLGDGIQACRDLSRDAVGLFRREQELRIECAGNCRLLHDISRVARVHLVNEPADLTRLFDNLAQVGPGALLARAEHKLGLLEAGVDQEVLQRNARP